MQFLLNWRINSRLEYCDETNFYLMTACTYIGKLYLIILSSIFAVEALKSKSFAVLDIRESIFVLIHTFFFIFFWNKSIGLMGLYEFHLMINKKWIMIFYFICVRITKINNMLLCPKYLQYLSYSKYLITIIKIFTYFCIDLYLITYSIWYEIT